MQKKKVFRDKNVKRMALLELLALGLVLAENFPEISKVVGDLASGQLNLETMGTPLAVTIAFLVVLVIFILNWDRFHSKILPSVMMERYGIQINNLHKGHLRIPFENINKVDIDNTIYIHYIDKDGNEDGMYLGVIPKDYDDFKVLLEKENPDIKFYDLRRKT
jgi:hypothetical protein